MFLLAVLLLEAIFFSYFIYRIIRREYAVPSKNDTVRSIGKIDASRNIPLNDSRWKSILGNTTSGVRRGLLLRLKPWQGSEHSSSLKVLVHDPSDPPNVRHWAIPIRTGMITLMGVKVKRISTTQSALRYPISIRNCFAEGEGSVYGGIESYNLKACFRNCVIYRSTTNCSCIPYYYGEWSNSSICTVKQYQCLKNRIKWNPALRSFNPKCLSCKPKCESTSYEVTFNAVTHSVSNCVVSEMCEHVSEKTTSLARDTAFLYIYLKSDSATTFKRDVLYGWNDLLSGIGGLLSLGIGISLVHVFEIAYLIIFR